MSDRIERACQKCGSLVHHEDSCPTPIETQSHITHLKSELEKCRVERDEFKHANKLRIDEINSLLTQRDISEQRVKDLVRVLELCEKYFGLSCTHPVSIEVSACLHTHKAIGEVVS